MTDHPEIAQLRAELDATKADLALARKKRDESYEIAANMMKDAIAAKSELAKVVAVDDLIMKASAAALTNLMAEKAELKSSLGAAYDAARIYSAGMEAATAEVTRLQGEVEKLKAASNSAAKRDMPIMALDDGPDEGIGWSQPNPLPRGMR